MHKSQEMQEVHELRRHTGRILRSGRGMRWSPRELQILTYR